MGVEAEVHRYRRGEGGMLWIGGFGEGSTIVWIVVVVVLHHGLVVSSEEERGIDLEFRDRR
jgi:hypothetical protein